MCKKCGVYVKAIEINCERYTTVSVKPCITLTVYFYSFHTYATFFTHFTLHPTLSLHIYTARAEYFLIPDDAVDRRKLGF